MGRFYRAGRPVGGDILGMASAELANQIARNVRLALGLVLGGCRCVGSDQRIKVEEPASTSIPTPS
jgi:hypothetical protein